MTDTNQTTVFDPGGPATSPAPADVAGFFSQNEAMRRCLELAKLACKSSAPIMISGENGSGKSILAAAIHNSSARRNRPCITLDCAALGEKAIKKRLFGDNGHGEAEGEAHDSGLIGKAEGGTLIIDDVDLLPGFVQRDLLFLLRESGESETRRSGGAFRFGTRLVTTSGGEHARRTAPSLLIEDLLYYLGEITVRIPPLRRRREDIPTLAAMAIATANRAYGKSVAGLSRTALDFLKHYDFPGNVRELFLVMDRGVMGTNRDTLYVEDLGPLVDSTQEDPHLLSDMTLMPLAEMEKRHIDRALLRTGWKKRAAARILRISLTLLERKIEHYGLEKGTPGE